jgi:hypothetical protein
MRSSHLTRGYKEIMYMALAVVATSKPESGKSGKSIVFISLMDWYPIMYSEGNTYGERAALGLISPGSCMTRMATRMTSEQGHEFGQMTRMTSEELRSCNP